MKACGITDIGLQRHENQDTFAVERGVADGQIIAVVCDGMGGENGGQVASRLAVRTFVEEMRAVLREDMDVQQLREAAAYCVSKANTAVNRHAVEHAECRGMGTTLVSAVTCANTAVVCNVGDSRAYRLGGGRAERITRDHSVVEGLVASGNITVEQARTHPNRNLITRALGPEASTACDVYEVTLAPGEALLLCSDGLVVTVQDKEILETVLRGAVPEESLKQLLQLSRQRGAPDNVTAVLLYEDNKGKEGMSWIR